LRRAERVRPWLRAANVGRLIDDAVRLHADCPAVIAGERTLTYAELDERASRVAAGLRGLGVRPGGVVALAVGNDWRFVELVLGVARAGAVSLLVNVKLGTEMLGYVIAHSEARILVTGDALAATLPALTETAATVEQVISVEPRPGGGLSYAEAFDAMTPSPEVADVDPDDLAMLLYTSGSTGRPKGVMLSHSSVWWQARSSARVNMHEWSDLGIIMGPLYHANALWAGMLPMLYVGGGLVILEEFDPAAALTAMDRYGVTYTSGTPSMFALLLAEAERGGYDGSSIEVLMCGSAPVPAELMERLTARFGCEIIETYGLSEGGANVISPVWGIKKPGSTGLPVPGVEIEVRDPDDPARRLGPGEVGELWTRSPANALGFLKQPEVTAARFSADGWLRTGDLVRRDDQGYVYFAGRTDDLISVGGENVYPKEVETILLQHPAVADVGVVGVPHALKGEAPVAWVVAKDGAAVTEDELRQFFLERGPAYAHPRRVFFRDALPLSATNKLDRDGLEREARERLPEGLQPGAGRPA
jgi:long-chain acyl-CoA synthetase